jgi:hypothetical protein
LLWLNSPNALSEEKPFDPVHERAASIDHVAWDVCDAARFQGLSVTRLGKLARIMQGRLANVA